MSISNYSFVIGCMVSLSCHAADINRLVAHSSAKYDVDPKLVKAVIKQESSFNTNAVSKAGATGIMQLMPDTAKRFGVHDRLNPAENIDGGVHYLRVLLDMFDGNIKLAVAGYNAGEGSVQKYNGIPPYPETQDYVKKVMGFYGKDTPPVVVEASLSDKFIGSETSFLNSDKNEFLKSEKSNFLTR